jgi:hypothetical protein
MKTSDNSGLPIVGGPFDGGRFWGGGPHEKVRIKTFSNGFYRLREDGQAVEWVPS